MSQSNPSEAADIGFDDFDDLDGDFTSFDEFDDDDSFEDAFDDGFGDIEEDETAFAEAELDETLMDDSLGDETLEDETLGDQTLEDQTLEDETIDDEVVDTTTAASSNGADAGSADAGSANTGATANTETRTATTVNDEDVIIDVGAPMAEDEADEDGPLEQIEFSIDSSTLVDMISEALRGKDLKNVMYVAAVTSVNDEGADRVIASDMGDGRIVVGAESKQRSNVFVDGPAREVTSPGVFLMNVSERVLKWAKAVRGVVSLKFVRYTETRSALFLDHFSNAGSSGSYEIGVPLLYDKTTGLQDQFAAVDDYFQTPSESFGNGVISDMLSVANKVKMKDGRAGDFFFRHDAELDTSSVEFVTRREFQSRLLETSQRVPFAHNQNLRWEITADQLSYLSNVVKDEDAAYAYDNGARVDDEGESYQIEPALQFFYHVSNDTYAHRQMTVTSDSSHLRDWTRDPETGEHHSTAQQFAQKESRHFATVQTDLFINALDAIWSLQPETVVRLTHATKMEDEHTAEFIQLLTNDNNGETIKAIHGDSVIDEFLLSEEMFDYIKKLSTGSSYLQLRTFGALLDGEADVQEHPELLFFVALDPGSDPTEIDNDPARYVLAQCG